jgi:hypothetical protein
MLSLRGLRRYPPDGGLRDSAATSPSVKPPYPTGVGLRYSPRLPAEDFARRTSSASLGRSTALLTQSKVVDAERQVAIADFNAQANVKSAEAQARAKTINADADATVVQVAEAVAKSGVRLMPDIVAGDEASEFLEYQSVR